MNPLPAPGPSSAWSRAAIVILVAVVTFVVVCVIGITGYFRLGSETAALRDSLMKTIPGQWEKQIALHVGPVTTGLIRFGSQFLALEAEPRAALDTLHGAEVGIYRLQGAPGSFDRRLVLERADKAMSRRGWDRVVGVIEGRQIVAVYFPHRGLSTKRMKCCVMVFQDRDLVVALARGNLEPLMAIAVEHCRDVPCFGHGGARKLSEPTKPKVVPAVLGME